MERRRLRMLDLFAGLGGASQAMVDRGWDVLTVDIDPRFGCTWTADILHWNYNGPAVDLVWASPPCTEFSRYFLPWFRGKYPQPSMDLVNASLRIIQSINPIWWVLENVAGSVSFISKATGKHPTKVGSSYLWGDFDSFERPKITRHKEKLSSRRKAERCKIPYAISLAVALSCERSIFSLEGSFPTPEPQLPGHRSCLDESSTVSRTEP